MDAPTQAPPALAAASSDREGAQALAQEWCSSHGSGWHVVRQLGSGGTAPVFEVASPDGPRALKIYDSKFSVGSVGAIEAARIDQQLALRGHDCPFLVQIYEGGKFQDRLFLLMGRAPGNELEKVLTIVQRASIRTIVHQVATAAIYLRSKGFCHRDIKSANVFVSDDFRQSTLLDVSVIRDVSDPVGVGTDHDGHLPMLATARYSPPEYLFRLHEPSADLWHALTIYQLGGLLHDLITQAPLFHEFGLASTNRYRFAWIVATAIPRIVRSDGVDNDLVLLARRALDKDWERRGDLKLEDFLEGEAALQRQALEALGFVRPTQPSSSSPLSQRIRLREIAERLSMKLAQVLRTTHQTTSTHEVVPSDDQPFTLVLSWPKGEGIPERVTVTINIGIENRHSKSIAFCLSVGVEIPPGAQARVDLPGVSDREGIEDELAALAESAIVQATIKALKVGGGY